MEQRKLPLKVEDTKVPNVGERKSPTSENPIFGRGEPAGDPLLDACTGHAVRVALHDDSMDKGSHKETLPAKV
jgi:hypothetical protein